MKLKKFGFYALTSVVIILAIAKIAGLIYVLAEESEKDVTWCVRQLIYVAVYVYLGIHFFKRARLLRTDGGVGEKFQSNCEDYDDEDEAFIDKDEIMINIKKHALPVAEIEVAQGSPDNPWGSKFSGVAYWPKNMDYPHDETNAPMQLLAQINFTEVPKVAGYPTEGVLQIFIAKNDLYGLDFPSAELPQSQIIQEQRNYRVIYHPDIKSLEADFYDVDMLNSEPIEKECKLLFEASLDYPGPADYRFAHLVTEGRELDDDVTDELYEADSGGSKIGGYASFTQGDPREENGVEQENWLLLLQIDSGGVEGCEIMWGDCGVCNFFIKCKDLKALDFTQVWYNWDCH